jgi:ParB/RepB/Spo0J family partition protein
MTEDELQSLADNIKIHGIQQKIIVRRVKDLFEIADGEHKIKALKMNGDREINVDLVDIRELTDAQMREYIRTSNTRGQRKNLVKEAELYLDDFTDSKMSISDYAVKIGVDASKISRILKRNNMGTPAKDFVQNNNITPTILDAVLTARPDMQLALLERVVKEESNVDDVKEIINESNTITGEPVKGKDKTRREVDLSKFDTVDRLAISQFLEISINYLSKINRYSNAKGIISVVNDSNQVMKRLSKLKRVIDGVTKIVDTKTGGVVRDISVTRNWLASGSEDERKEKHLKIQERMELISKS